MSRHAIFSRRRNGTQRPRRRWTERFGLDVLRARWKNSMPKFFRRVCWICALISGTALAANTAITAGGGTTHEWWNEIYPYLLGIPAGAAFVAKFTQNYDKHGNPIVPDETGHRSEGPYDRHVRKKQRGSSCQLHENNVYLSCSLCAYPVLRLHTS